MAPDPAHISLTAKVSAYYRKFSDIAFAAEVAMLEERWLELNTEIEAITASVSSRMGAKPGAEAPTTTGTWPPTRASTCLT